MTGVDELACREFVEVVTEYLEGTLDAVQRARFEAHLGECPYCGIYLEQMRQTIAALGRLPPESIPEAGKSELLRLFRAWKHEDSADRRSQSV
jgi:anti-sigma factor RsiW